MAGVEALVLIIEDDPLVARLLGRAFALDGYQTIFAGSAAEARRALALHCPALITLDLYLPDAQGLALLAQLLDEGLGDTPVVVITTDAAVARARPASVAAVLVKPFSIGELLDIAAQLTGSGRTRALGE